MVFIIIFFLLIVIVLFLSFALYVGTQKVLKGEAFFSFFFSKGKGEGIICAFFVVILVGGKIINQKKGLTEN